MKKKKTKKRNEVRIVGIADSTFAALQRDAKISLRTIQKEAMNTLIEKHK